VQFIRSSVTLPVGRSGLSGTVSRAALCYTNPSERAGSLMTRFHAADRTLRPSGTSYKTPSLNPGNLESCYLPKRSGSPGNPKRKYGAVSGPGRIIARAGTIFPSES